MIKPETSTAITITARSSANPTAVTTESIENTMSSTKICAITDAKELAPPFVEVSGASPSSL